MTQLPLNSTDVIAYGNHALQTKWKDACSSIARMEHINQLWSRANTRFSVDNLTISCRTSSPWRQLRQVAAELEGRTAAMREVKWKLLRMDIEIQIAKRDIESETDELKRKLIHVDIAEKEDRIASILIKFEGAMRDVRDLEANYDRIIDIVGKDITEEKLDAAENESHIRRAVTQAVRSVRHCGAIDPGNQEYLEQLGVNPSRLFIDIVNFIAEEQKTTEFLLPAFIENVYSGISREAIGDKRID
jgi:hypothetical protein